MHPLLVSAVTSTAGNFLDRWARGAGASAAAPATAPATSFQKVLDGKSPEASQAAAVARTPAERAADRLAKLRTELLDAPEIRAALDTADPTKPATISLSPDGRILSTPPGRYPQAILLSPETAEIARELASLTTARGALPLSTMAGSLSHVMDSRVGSLDLVPATGLTTLR